MTVTRAEDRSHDRRVRTAIPIDDSPDRRGCDEGHVDERDEGRRQAGPIDHSQPYKQRRQLALLELRILDKPGGQAARRKCVHDHVRVGPDDDDDVIDLGVEKGTHDASQEGVAALERQHRLRPSHAGRFAGGKYNGGDHRVILDPITWLMR